MMMKKPLSPAVGLALLALSVALAGCPALETGLLTGLKPTPEPSASAPSEEDQKDQDDKTEPAFAIKALGPVRAHLEGPIDVEQGPFTMRIGLQYDYYEGYKLENFGRIGRFEEKSISNSGYDANYTPVLETPGVYEYRYRQGTHTFIQSPGSDYLAPGALTFAIGDVPPIAERRTADTIELDFPAATRGDLTATPADSALRFRRSHQDSTILSTFEATSSLPLNHFETTRSATLSATVSVQELDGSPSTGLTSANFRLSSYWYDRPIAIQATETAAGVYRLTMAFDGLDGYEPRPQRRMLTVTHATLTQTHTQPTPDVPGEEMPR